MFMFFFCLLWVILFSLVQMQESLLMSGVIGPGSVPASCLLTAGIELSGQREKQNDKQHLKLGIKVI